MNTTSTPSKELIDLFLSLATIDGISLHERNIADHVKTLLQTNNVKVIEDGTGAKIKGNTGNLICFPPHYDESKPAIALCAHLDTVTPTKDLRPVVTDDRISSDGTTILGGDNREGLSILLYLMMNLNSLKSPVKNFICVFTVGEELGMYGANHVDLSPYNVKEAYVFDCSKRPGIYIKDCAGCMIFTAKFHGKSAHAGVAPEQGINAITLASKALANVRFGRIDEETTSNIGKITGGGATNVVPNEVVIDGEVRSFTKEKIEQQFSIIKEGFQRSLDGTGGSYSITSEMDFHPYVLDVTTSIVTTIEKAIRAAGLQPQGIRYTGGSDANSYNAKGIPSVNIGIGAQKPHAFEEFILIEDLIISKEIAFALVQE
ncbi:MAG: M20/M25/M40 family metallo-hydrolase [Bacteroidota bacterium]